jgi:rhamnulokinase
MRMTSCALERPVRAGPVEASSTGNILAQLLALGEIKDRWDARAIVGNSFSEVVYEPGRDAESGWREALARYNEKIRGK